MKAQDVLIKGMSFECGLKKKLLQTNIFVEHNSEIYLMANFSDKF